MSDATSFSAKMGDLQKLRIAAVILLSEENSQLLRRRQRVAGKEIEVMCAERDLAADAGGSSLQEALAALRAEELEARRALAETEQEVRRLEALLAKLNADIAALCQS